MRNLPLKEAVFLLFLPVIFPGCTGVEEHPNIILMMADDLGWGDTGYNGNAIIQTPNLDKMSREGIRFDRFYSASAVCSPTRASVLTGRNPFRMGVYTANQGILRPEEITLPEILKEHGYTTGHFGKWHLGTLTHTEMDANRGRPGNVKEYNPPALHGYDVAFVTESKVPTWDPMRKPPDATRFGWNALAEGEPFEPFGTHYRDIEGNKVTENLDGDDSRVIMDRVIPFIEGAVENNEPFFAVVWFHAPHMPCVAGPEYRAMYKDQAFEMQNYGGCITALDEQVGRLRSFLKKQGVEKNTMIWFCSDNGPENGSPGSTGGFRERKRSLHEGGIRVPGLMVWPERVKNGFVTDEPCVTSDYMPTILDVLCISTSGRAYELDGTSLLPLIETGNLHRKKPIGFLFGNQAAWMSGEHKLYSSHGDFSLYRIVEDPYEKADISDSLDDLKNELIKDLEFWLQSCRASFEGAEYGRESVERMGQEWVNPLMNHN